MYVLCKCQFSGKVCKCEFSNVLIKCDLMACWLNVAVVGLPPLAKSVAVAIAKTPQSYTELLWSLLKFDLCIGSKQA